MPWWQWKTSRVSRSRPWRYSTPAWSRCRARSMRAMARSASVRTSRSSRGTPSSSMALSSWAEICLMRAGLVGSVIAALPTSYRIVAPVLSDRGRRQDPVRVPACTVRAGSRENEVLVREGVHPPGGGMAKLDAEAGVLEHLPAGLDRLGRYRPCGRHQGQRPAHDRATGPTVMGTPMSALLY